MDRQSQPDSQGFMQRMALPLPEANALWQSREKIALRAFFLLDCVQNWLAPDGAHAHLTLPRSALMQHDISSLLIEYIVQTLHECLAGKAFVCPIYRHMSCHARQGDASSMLLKLCMHQCSILLTMPQMQA